MTFANKLVCGGAGTDVARPDLANTDETKMYAGAVRFNHRTPARNGNFRRLSIAQQLLVNHANRLPRNTTF